MVIWIARIAASAAPRNNILYQQEIIRKQNYEKAEHISTISTDRLKAENRAQIANDISVDTTVDMPSDTNQISTDISTAENGQNRAQITSVSRSVGSVDICSLSSQNQAKLPEVAETLGNYVAFDFEWDPVTQVLEAVLLL